MCVLLEFLKVYVIMNLQVVAGILILCEHRACREISHPAESECVSAGDRWAAHDKKNTSRGEVHSVIVLQT